MKSLLPLFHRDEIFCFLFHRGGKKAESPNNSRKSVKSADMLCQQTTNNIQQAVRVSPRVSAFPVECEANSTRVVN
jgi:hypothetical protein